MAETFSNWSRRQLSTGGGVLSGQDPLDPLDELNIFLVQAVVILSICRALGVLGHYLKQPKVIFEIIGGILLGPSAIGRNEKYLERIFPKESLGYLKLVAEIGLVLYLFLVGMELDVDKLATHARKAGGVAIFGMAVPFGLGIAISSTMFKFLEAEDPNFADVSPTSFFVFIGVSMSITAFPVLARILKEGGLIYTKVGALVMGAAALNDAIAWCLLILAISLANASNMSIAGYVFLSVLAYAIGLYVIVRPIFERFIEYMEAFNSKAVRNNLFALTLMLCFISAWTTALLGLDAIFGSFLFGLIIPRKSKLFHDCNEYIEEFVLTVTLPLYFALSGLKTDVTQISTKDEGAMIVLVCFIATIGKFIGAGGFAWASGWSFREASVVAVLMNTRGLVELIVLNLGMQSGILNTRCFSVMVIMCLFTTFMTCPLVELIFPPHMRETEVETVIERKQSESHAEVPELSAGIILSQKRRNIGVVVDRIEFLQYTMNVLARYAPGNKESKLGVSAVKLFEPSKTETDNLIGLNEEGRLILTEPEPVSFDEMNRHSFYSLNKETSKYSGRGNGKLLPILFPLSMFCKSLGIDVKALDVKGNPREFPREMSSIFNNALCDFAILPWRDSEYFERFFWTSLRTYNRPIALLSSPASYTYEFADSQFQHTDAPEQEEPASRQNRSRSIFFRDDSSYEAPQMDIDDDKIRNVFAIISGHAADIHIFSSISRFLEHPDVSVTVAVDVQHMSEDYSTFKKAIDSNSNCTFMEVTAWGMELLKNELSKTSYDLLIHAVVSPLAPSSSESDAPRARTERSGSVFAAPVKPSILESRIQLGVPSNLLAGNLQFPELGVVGDYIFRNRSKVSNFERMSVLVFHSPTIAEKSADETSKAAASPSAEVEMAPVANAV